MFCFGVSNRKFTLHIFKIWPWVSACEMKRPLLPSRNIWLNLFSCHVVIFVSGSICVNTKNKYMMVKIDKYIKNGMHTNVPKLCFVSMKKYGLLWFTLHLFWWITSLFPLLPIYVNKKLLDFTLIVHYLCQYYWYTGNTETI